LNVYLSKNLHMKYLTSFTFFALLTGIAEAQTDVWKRDAETLASTIRTVALKNQYRKMIGWNWAKQGSFFADSAHDYAIVYVYENTNCQVVDLTITEMSTDSTRTPAHAVTDKALVYKTASGMYLLMGPRNKKTPFKIDATCNGAMYVLWRPHRNPQP